MRKPLPWLLSILLAACGGGGEGGPREIPRGPSDTCGSVRLTAYTAGTSGWCEIPRDADFLPSFVLEGLTAAIAEPWNGGSYEGEPGEGCGECWEISTVNATRTVMITDLCPIRGNPLCAGEHFHVDLASEAAAALGGGGLDEGTARRVACPVSGNIRARVHDRSVWYLRFSPMNHRVPIREIAFRGAGAGVSADNPWLEASRSGGAWALSRPSGALANGGDAVELRLTSVQGEVVESGPIPTSGGNGVYVDLGVQLADLMPTNGPACEHLPPATIYDDGFGGIAGARWMIDPWGAAESGPYGEVTQNCYGDTGSCLRVRDLDRWSGFHLYYRQAFATSTFTAVSLRARTISGQGSIQIAPGHDGARCTGTTVGIGETYTEFTIVLSEVCAGMSLLSSLTIDNPGPDIGLLLDDVRFVR